MICWYDFVQSNTPHSHTKWKILDEIFYFFSYRTVPSTTHDWNTFSTENTKIYNLFSRIQKLTALLFAHWFGGAGAAAAATSGGSCLCLCLCLTVSNVCTCTVVYGNVCVCVLKCMAVVVRILGKMSCGAWEVAECRWLGLFQYKRTHTQTHMPHTYMGKLMTSVINGVWHDLRSTTARAKIASLTNTHTRREHTSERTFTVNNWRKLCGKYCEICVCVYRLVCVWLCAAKKMRYTLWGN